MKKKKKTYIKKNQHYKLNLCAVVRFGMMFYFVIHVSYHILFKRISWGYYFNATLFWFYCKMDVPCENDENQTGEVCSFSKPYRRPFRPKTEITSTIINFRLFEFQQ